MDTAPKCRLCGVKHWGWEGHALPAGTPRVDALGIRFPGVTPSVTPLPTELPLALHVTPDVTASGEGTPDVTLEEHDCPLCHWRHRRPRSDAERVRAYRRRKREGSGG